MCGIAGILHTSGKAADPALLNRMIGAIRHRGPDDMGVHTDRNVGNAHVGPASSTWRRTPATSIADGSLWYYVQWGDLQLCRTSRRADCQGAPVLHEVRYGSDSSSLSGGRGTMRRTAQWTMGVRDLDAPHANKLFVSRDRLGVRPLFYTQTPDSFVFASEVKALFECPGIERQLDLKGLDETFTFWSPLPSNSVFRNVKQLPAGHSLVLEDGRLRISQYWNLDLAPGSDGIDGNEERLTEDLLALLTDATRIRLRLDVPFGTYLSVVLTDAGHGTGQTSGRRQVAFPFSGLKTPSSTRARIKTKPVRSSERSTPPSTAPPKISARYFRMSFRIPKQPILRTAPAPSFSLQNWFETAVSKLF